MAVSFDASGTYAGGGLPGTYSLTIGGGANRVLIVGNAFWWNGGTITTGAGTVTFQGSPMTLVPNSGTASSDADFWTEQWYLVNPPSGLGTVIFIGNILNTTQRSSASSWTGVDQVTPIDTNTTVANSNDPISGTLTTTGANEYILDVLSHASSNTITAGAGQTEILNVNSSGVTAGASYLSQVSAGLGTLSWTCPGGPSAYSLLALKASGGVVATTFVGFKTLLGVGV